MRLSWTACLPPAIVVALLLIPAPEGLAPHAWHFFAVFVGVIVGLMTEPIPGPAISFIGVTIVALLSPWMLYSPEQLSAPGFNAANASLDWALSGFANSTVWLIFGAFTFALGYEKTGLGRRLALLLVRAMGHRTVTLGYAVVAADALMAPFTPSSTARSGGTIYPAIRNLPPLYGSMPNEPSRRLLGSYLMWTALAAVSVTSSMFLTGMAPNLLAVELVAKGVNIQITWMSWFMAAAPVGFLLLIALPWLAYVLYPPTIKEGKEVVAFAAEELRKLGGLSKRELLLIAFVLLALILWTAGADLVNPTTTAMAVVGLMVVTGIVTWNDVVANKAAWTTLVWFATLIALADGLDQTGFIPWFAKVIGAHLGGFSPTMGLLVLVSAYFLSHYLFASVTAHTTAMLPIMLAIGSTIPGMPMEKLSLMLVTCGGIMGILTPYAGGANPVYSGSGYLPAADFWRLGAIFGLIFLAAWLCSGLLLLPAR